MKENTTRRKDATDILDHVATGLEHWADLLETMETATAKEQLLALKAESARNPERLPPASLPGSNSQSV